MAYLGDRLVRESASRQALMQHPNHTFVRIPLHTVRGQSPSHWLCLNVVHCYLIMVGSSTCTVLSLQSLQRSIQVALHSSC